MWLTESKNENLHFEENRDTRRRKGTNKKEKWDIFNQPNSRCRYLNSSYLASYVFTLERQYIGASEIFLFQNIHNGSELWSNNTKLHFHINIQYSHYLLQIVYSDLLSDVKRFKTNSNDYFDNRFRQMRLYRSRRIVMSVPILP